MESAMSYEDLSNDLRSNDVISEGQHRPVAGEELPTEEQQNLIEPQELPFYLMRAPPPEETVNGSTNLILHNERQNSFKKYCCKKVAEPLSAFLHDFPGNVDTTSFFTSGEEAKETSTLNSLLDPKLQVNVKKEIYPLTNEQLQSFTLYPGSVLPEKYMLMVQSTLSNSEPISTSSKKPKKSKRSSNETEQANGSSAAGALGSEKSEKKKKKKEKKKKKDKDKEKDKDKDKEKEKKSASND